MLFVGLLMSLCAPGTNALLAQSGDQFPVGIGETGLIASCKIKRDEKATFRRSGISDQVLKPGTYTVTGRVPGTDLQPQAIVTVSAAGEPASQ